MKQKRLTFKEIQEAAKRDNAIKLMGKAKKFNDFAKMLEENGNVCYKRKNQCIKQLLDKCRDNVSVVKDDIALSHNGILLVRLKEENNGRPYVFDKSHVRGGVHTHNDWLKTV
jgi:hypothetical protein